MRDRRHEEGGYVRNGERRVPTRGVLKEGQRERAGWGEGEREVWGERERRERKRGRWVVREGDGRYLMLYLMKKHRLDRIVKVACSSAWRLPHPTVCYVETQQCPFTHPSHTCTSLSPLPHSITATNDSSMSFLALTPYQSRPLSLPSCLAFPRHSLSAPLPLTSTNTSFSSLPSSLSSVMA